jgi:GNAT superfamily N-acetyltransferase
VLVYRAVGEALTGDRQAAIERIYLESFPPSERDPFADLWAAITSGKRELMIAERGQSVVGFGVTVAIGEIGCVVLEYLAIDRLQRDAGAGGELLDAIVATGRARDYPRGGGLLLEVERRRPEDGPSDERTRRIHFYEQRGGAIVHCAPEFTVPSLVPREPARAMQLMWVPFDDTPTPSGPRLRDLVRALFTTSYELPPDHEILRRNLETLVC